jgi:glycosyltransferase involved in cell wall biosynthesis
MNCRKGTDLLLNAFSHVKGSARLVIHSQVPLSLFGNDAAIIVKNNPRIEFIEKTCASTGLIISVMFLFIPPVSKALVCVCQSLACGLPVITTDNAPMNEFVQDNVKWPARKRSKQQDNGKTVYYWPEKVADVDDLTQKMQTYVDDKEMLQKHKIQARKSAGRHLDWLKKCRDLNEKLRALHNNTNKKRRPSWLHEKIKWWCEARIHFLTIYNTHNCQKDY